MSEGGDYEPAPWARDHDFSAQRDAYAATAGRSYDDAKKKGKTVRDLVPVKIKTKSGAVLIVLVDVSASMEGWLDHMFSKLPFFEHEAKVYLGDDLEISFGAIDDAHGDDYSFQIRPFRSGEHLKTSLEELVHERGGGGGTGSQHCHESHELAMLYCLHNVETPNAKKPVLVMVTDELPYERVSRQQAMDIARVDLETDLDTTRVVMDLKKRFDVYLVFKRGYYPGDEAWIHDRWVELLGADHISDLDGRSADDPRGPKRVVDVILGFLAVHAGKAEEFEEEIIGRQTPEQVDTVFQSLRTVHTFRGGSSAKRRGGTTHHRPSTSR